MSIYRSFSYICFMKKFQLNFGLSSYWDDFSISEEKQNKRLFPDKPFLFVYNFCATPTSTFIMISDSLSIQKIKNFYRLFYFNTLDSCWQINLVSVDHIDVDSFLFTKINNVTPNVVLLPIWDMVDRLNNVPSKTAPLNP